MVIDDDVTIMHIQNKQDWLKTGLEVWMSPLCGINICILTICTIKANTSLSNDACHKCLQLTETFVIHCTKWQQL